MNLSIHQFNRVLLGFAPGGHEKQTIKMQFIRGGIERGFFSLNDVIEFMKYQQSRGAMEIYKLPSFEWSDEEVLAKLTDHLNSHPEKLRAKGLE